MKAILCRKNLDMLNKKGEERQIHLITIFFLWSQVVAIALKGK